MADIIGTKDGDVLKGGTLQNTIMGKAGADVIEAGDAGDMIDGGADDDSIFGGAGNDILFGGTGADFISDGAGVDFVNGGEGDDLVFAGAGNDNYNGGKGFDTIDFSGSAKAMTIDMGRGLAADGREGDIVQGFERVVGSSLADDIKGSSAADVIDAGAGNNVIRGAGGADTLRGGGESDRFVWRTTDVVDAAGTHLGVDAIDGFARNDVLDLRLVLGIGNVADMTQEQLDAAADLVQLTDTAGGTMLSASVNGAMTDIALLRGFHTGGATAIEWASDGIILT